MKKLLLISILIFVQGAWGGGKNDLPPIDNSDQKPKVNVDDLKSSIQIIKPSDITQKIEMPTNSVADVSCLNAQSRVNTICIGNRNPGIQKAASAIAAIGTAGLSMVDACSKFNSLLKDANEAIIAYNGVCAAAGYYCQKTCQTAAGTHNSADSGIKLADETVIADCSKNMKANLIDAAMGIGGIAASSMLGKQCEDKTTDSSSTGTCDTTTNSQCISGIDCSLSANATNPTCICNASPSTPGCPGATNYGSGYSSTSYGSNTTTNNTGTNSTVSGTGSGSDSPAAVRSQTLPQTSADGSSTGAGGGYGGAISGDSIAQTNAESKKGQTADKKGLNTNILSGDDGGGGGGGYRGSRGGSGDSNYNAYMPGQKKDPSRALASQNAASSQVTSAGSKSNWEKVTERYTENKSTLMGD